MKLLHGIFSGKTTAFFYVTECNNTRFIQLQLKMFEFRRFNPYFYRKRNIGIVFVYFLYHLCVAC